MLKIDLNIDNYWKKSSKIKKLNWVDLPDQIKLQVKTLPSDIKKLGEFTTVRRLKESKFTNIITKNITAVKKEMMGKNKFKIKFPIDFDNKEYAELYALMISEGSHTAEFSINVPEGEFHDLFRQCIKKLISKESSEQIKIDYNNRVMRSRAPAILRHLIPVSNIIPELIAKNKELSREYLRIAFEAEGSPIFDEKHKRYIKLTRYTDITKFISEEVLSKKRMYAGQIKKEYQKLWKRISIYPPDILLGESLMLKHHFSINNKLVLEAVRKNKTEFRAGKITARWVLLIYANNINKFIQEINFISERKQKKCQQMLNIRANNQQYSTFKIIQKISKNNLFFRKDFILEMKKIGYKSPGCYLCRFQKKGLIKTIRRGYFKIISLPDGLSE